MVVFGRLLGQVLLDQLLDLLLLRQMIVIRLVLCCLFAYPVHVFLVLLVRFLLVFLLHFLSWVIILDRARIHTY